MSKAMTEIEMPKRCKDCVWYQADSWFGGSCGVSKEESGWNKQIAADEEYNVQKWCPLISKKDIIPVKWIKKWVEDSWELECDYAIYQMIDDWEKEND